MCMAEDVGRAMTNLVNVVTSDEELSDNEEER